MIRTWTGPALLMLLMPGCAPDEGEPEQVESMDPGGIPASRDELSDEFEDASTLSDWRIWHEVAGVAPTHAVLDIDTTVPNAMVIVPRTGGWFGGFEGPLVYKVVQGNFRVEVEVTAAKQGRPSDPPDEQFNSAGLMMRDSVSGEGNDNWVMFNTGRQLGMQIASEGKTTVDSQSTLELIDGPQAGVLRMCRVGATIVLARRLDGEASLVELHRYDRPDFPEDLQVGLITNGWNSGTEMPDTNRDPDLEARFEYIRFSPIDDASDCTDP